MSFAISCMNCLTIGGKYAVAALLEGGAVGEGLIILGTKAAAQEFIDSGKADELDRKSRR
jgi:hypothetical protein